MTTSNESGEIGGKDPRDAHAIVVGGSITGLLATRALTEHFRAVTLIERDHFPEDPSFRKGVPQMRHVHVLLKRGERIMAYYFPELLPELLAGGADLSIWAATCAGSTSATGRLACGVDFFCQSRGFLEMKIRERLATLPGVRILDECDVAGYTIDAGGHIDGVKVHRAAGTEEHFTADLVVDASGRGSRTPQWLEQLGFEKPPEIEVKVNVGYASRFYRKPKNAAAEWTGLMIYPKPPETRLGVLFPVENDRWMLTLVGWFGDHPPTDEAGFLGFAASLPVPDLYDAIKDAEPLSPIASHRFLSNRRRQYERMPHFPDGLVILGDALCSFNPIYMGKAWPPALWV